MIGKKLFSYQIRNATLLGLQEMRMEIKKNKNKLSLLDAQPANNYKEEKYHFLIIKDNKKVTLDLTISY